MSAPTAIILAAGKSTRMKSDMPKVLHDVCGRPMLAHVLAACREAGVPNLLVVVGYGKDAVKDAFSHESRITWVDQAEQKGTGHAALMCEPMLSDFDGPVFVIAGDMPLLRAETLGMIGEEHSRAGNGVTLATSVFDDPTGYGRIVRDQSGRLRDIVEESDATPEQRAIREVNISYYCFDCRGMLDALQRIRPDNAKGEYYITDAVRIMIADGHGAGALSAVDPQDAEGINSRADLARINALMQQRIQEGWMDHGITIVDPAKTWIEVGCEIGVETVIHPFTYVGRGSRIGQGCHIGPFAHVTEDEPVPSGAVVRHAPLVKATMS